jgi:hypothetical protein
MVTIQSSTFIAEGQQWVQIPMGATEAELTIENEVWINVWRNVVTLQVPVDKDTCMNIWVIQTG